MSSGKDLKCTPYELYDVYEFEGRNLSPCHCPVCGAFLKWDNDEKLKCTKCGAGLLVIPDIEDDGTPLETGKICPISFGNKKKQEGAVT